MPCGEFFVELGLASENVRGCRFIAREITRSSPEFVVASPIGLGWSPTIVRVIFVVVSVLSAAFPGIIAYLVMWVLMPKARVV